MPSKTALFPDYIRQKLELNGYKCRDQRFNDVFMQTPNGETITWICYLDAPIQPEQIRRCFSDTAFHILFVVDDKLIPQDITDRQSTPMWLRVLHGLYMGRVYTWNGRFLYGLHFDYDEGEISESGIINPDELLLVETGTWLRGWADQYKLARFYDRAWWMGSQSGDSGYKSEGYYNGGTGQKSWWDQRQEYARQQKQEYDNPWAKQEPPKYNYGGSEQKQNKQSYGYYGGTGKNPPKQDATGERDFGKEFRACDTLQQIKALYRKLAQEFHPDLNSDRDTTAIMQAINLAYERAKNIYA